jgi:raffinose/stachyose/melibiose transport system permease protein
MLLLVAIWFLPIYYLLVTTIKTPQEAVLSPLGLPSRIMIENYIYAWTQMEYPRAFFNTFVITASAVTLLIILSGLAGYALARTKTVFSSRIFLFFLAGLVVPFQMNIVSLYKIVKSLFLMNNPLAVILVSVSMNLPQAIFLLKEFIEATIPKELEEAADIDGCSVISKYFRVVFPLLSPVVSTVAIIVTLNVWNEFMTPLLFLHTREKGVILQEVSRNIGQFAVDWTAMFPMMLLGAAPLIIFYVFMQKYIIAGVAAGAVKG